MLLLRKYVAHVCRRTPHYVVQRREKVNFWLFCLNLLPHFLVWGRIQEGVQATRPMTTHVTPYLSVSKFLRSFESSESRSAGNYSARDGFRRYFDHSKENPGRAVGHGTTLFPFLDGSNAETKSRRELRLRQPDFPANCLNVRNLRFQNAPPVSAVRHIRRGFGVGRDHPVYIFVGRAFHARPIDLAAASRANFSPGTPYGSHRALSSSPAVRR